MLGEKNIQILDKIVEIESPGSPGRAPTADDQAYPKEPTDVSPNGEILAFRGEDAPYLATFSDSLNLARSSTTAVAVSLRTPRVSWLSGNRVLYETPDWDRVRNQILTLGIKRKSGGQDASDLPDKQNAIAASLSVMDLLGATHQEVEAKLGSPNERNDFNSLYVLHLRYEIKGLGSVRLMFQAVDQDFQETWLERVEIAGMEPYSDQAWASKLGLNLSDGWKLLSGNEDALYTRNINYPDSKGRRYSRTGSTGNVSIEFGHNPKNKAIPNMAVIATSQPKSSNKPITRRESNRITKLLRMRRPEIDKELGNPISTKIGNGQETCTYRYPGTEGLTITYFGQGTGTRNDIPGGMEVSFSKGTSWQTAVQILDITGAKLIAKPWDPIKGGLEITGHRYWPHSFIFAPENARYSDGELVNSRGLPQVSID